MKNAARIGSAMRQIENIVTELACDDKVSERFSANLPLSGEVSERMAELSEAEKDKVVDFIASGQYKEADEFIKAAKVIGKPRTQRKSDKVRAKWETDLLGMRQVYQRLAAETPPEMLVPVKTGLRGRPSLPAAGKKLTKLEAAIKALEKKLSR